MLIVKEGDYFGDIELSFSKRDELDNPKRKFTVSCFSEKATVYYSPYSKFMQLVNLAMKERMIRNVTEKRRIFNKRYEDALKGVELFIEEKKFNLFSGNEKKIEATKERRSN